MDARVKPEHDPERVHAPTEASIVLPISIAEYTALLIREHASSASVHFPLLFAARSVEMGRSRGIETLHEAVGVDRNGTSSAHMAGGVAAHVQSFGLKVAAAVLRAVF
jgi:hypothetical protein